MQSATRLVIDYFEQINRIPRCSKNEHQLSQWIQDWALTRELAVTSDSAGNLVIRVPATQGFEKAPVVVIQGHMDMVCEKRDDFEHDFSKDPIVMVSDGSWLAAQGTTLGADNGIAIAMAMAIVDSPQVQHPGLELFFTVDEETGLTGVLQMDPDLLSGKMLINLDSEDEGVFVVGCAGGRITTIERSFDFQTIANTDVLVRLSADGMQGGHSGVDIAKHRANANKIMTRMLAAGLAVAPIQVVAMSGGTGKNVIPRTCDALVACRHSDGEALAETLAATGRMVEQEYRETDPGLRIRIDPQGTAAGEHRRLSAEDTVRVVRLLMALPSGPVEMCPDFPEVVQTSANLSMVAVREEGLSIISSQRSSIPSRLDAICQAVEAVGYLAGARVHTNQGYPSWPVNRDSALLHRCTALYRQLFSAEPTVQVMHAGLECGVIGDRCTGMDMISLGPTIENPHSPSERLHLPSVEKVWRLLVALLASF